MKVGLRLAHSRKQVPASDALATQPSESVPSGSASNLTAAPTQTADSLGVVGWVVASASILVGFIVISGATGVDREGANNRRVNSFIPEQTKIFRSPSDPISMDPPMAMVDDTIYGQQTHNTASMPQQSALGEEKDTLDDKEVRTAFPVQVQKAKPIRSANSIRAD